MDIRMMSFQPEMMVGNIPVGCKNVVLSVGGQDFGVWSIQKGFSFLV